MSRIRDVIKNKNRVAKNRQLRRKNEMETLRTTTEYKARLYDEIKHIEMILHDPDIDAVTVTIPDKHLAQFTQSIHTEDLAGYDIKQVENEVNKFYIRRKIISLK